jgi:hypothetical protein
VTAQMIDAGARLAAVHRRVGRVTAAMLTELVEPLVVLGQVRVWREAVRRVTGEAERHAQAALVRNALSDLHFAYEAFDKAAAARRKTTAPRSAA